MIENFDVMQIRKQFPCLNQEIYKKPLVYFDSAATSQKPQCVIDEVTQYYSRYCGNVNRGAHYLSESATKKYAEARATVASFLGAQSKNDIIFCRSTTEAINLVATNLAKVVLKPGDEIILTEMEHHANIVPWYFLTKELGIKINVVPILDDGTLDLQTYKQFLNKKIKFAAFTHVSNTLGTINPIKEMISMAREQGVITLVDGAQATHHLPVDVMNLGVDFYVFSGHKTYGPTGIGALYMKPEWFEKFPPYQGGGDMIASVSFENITFASGPNKFEAGTPNISGALGLKKAIDFLLGIGLKNIAGHEKDLHDYTLLKLSQFKNIIIAGSAKEKVGVISFSIDGVHPHDISSILDREGIAIRSGHMCTQPLMKRLGVNSLCRISFGVYNTRSEIDIFINALKKVFEVFKL